MSRDRGIEEALRRAMSAEAETVETAADALGTIRGRIERRSRRWWVPRPGTPRGFALTLAGAAAAVVLAAGAVAVAADWPGHRGGPGPGPGASGPSATGTPVAGTNLPVYYLGSSTVEDRLYREYHVVPALRLSAEQAVTAAVNSMLGRAADDRDYHSPWPVEATVGGVTIDGAGVATVDLVDAAGGAAFDATVDDLTARMALQQLVYTVTAAVPATATSTGVTGVRLLLDGQPASTLWGKATASGVLQRGPAADVLAPIWIIDPQQGTRQGHRFTVRVAGIVFEAKMRLRVRDEAGTVLSDQMVNLVGGAPAQGTATVDMTLQPGRYTIEGYVISERDGVTEQVYDDHQFTVG